MKCVWNIPHLELQCNLRLCGRYCGCAFYPDTLCSAKSLFMGFNKTNTIMIDRNHNMMPPHFRSYQDMCIKSNLRFESSAISVSVAMSPCNLGGKHREYARAAFCGMTLIVRCVWKLNFCCPLSFQPKMGCSSQLRYIRTTAARYVLQGDRMLDEGSAFDQAWAPSWLRDAPLVANFKCEVAEVDKHIHIGLRCVKCVCNEYDRPYH